MGRGKVSPRLTPAQFFNRHAPPPFSWRLQHLWEQQANFLSRGSAALREQAPGALPGNSEEAFLPLRELDWPDRLPHSGGQRAGKGPVMFLAWDMGTGLGSPQGFPAEMWSLGQRLCPPSAQKCKVDPLSIYGWGPGGQNTWPSMVKN